MYGVVILVGQTFFGNRVNTLTCWSKDYRTYSELYCDRKELLGSFLAFTDRLDEDIWVLAHPLDKAKNHQMNHLVEENNSVVCGKRLIWLKKTNPILENQLDGNSNDRCAFWKSSKLFQIVFWHFVALCLDMQTWKLKARAEPLRKLEQNQDCEAHVHNLQILNNHESPCVAVLAQVKGNWPIAKSTRIITSRLVVMVKHWSHEPKPLLIKRHIFSEMFCDFR